MAKSGDATPDSLAIPPLQGFASGIGRVSAEEEICMLYQHLREAKSDLQMLSAEMLVAQELERKRIATELHDSVGSSIGSVSFGIDAALMRARSSKTPEPDLINLLELVSLQVRGALCEVRRISHGLRPSSLDDLGLISTLSWMVREFRVVHPTIALIADIAVEESDIHPALRTPMFRIVQEAVNNAVKHAHASKIGISLGQTECEICLEVFDNGVGFDPQQRTSESSSGMGLRGMADRITISGGCFRLNSMPGEGTRVLACWPVASSKSLARNGGGLETSQKAGSKSA